MTDLFDLAPLPGHPRRKPGITRPSHRCPCCGDRTRRQPRWATRGRDERCARCARLGHWPKQNVKRQFQATA